MRLFRRFDQATLMRVFSRLYRWFIDNLQVNYLTLDLDSTVMTRYGQQEGAARGYNPRKPGRCCVFHGNWTLSPRQTGQSERSDAGVVFYS